MHSAPITFVTPVLTAISGALTAEGRTSDIHQCEFNALIDVLGAIHERSTPLAPEALAEARADATRRARDAAEEEASLPPDVLATVAETEITGMQIEQGRATLGLQPSHELLMLMAASFRTILGEAVNYVELQFHHPEEGRYAVSVTRPTGKSPHELRKALEGLVTAYDNLASTIHDHLPLCVGDGDFADASQEQVAAALSALRARQDELGMRPTPVTPTSPPSPPASA